MHACDPAAALAAVAAHQPLPRHYLTVLADRPGLREAYKRAGYRLGDTETLMVCDLATLAPLTSSSDVTLLSEDAADWHNRNDPQGTRWALPENLAHPRVAHYALVRDGQLVAWPQPLAGRSAQLRQPGLRR